MPLVPVQGYLSARTTRVAVLILALELLVLHHIATATQEAKEEQATHGKQKIRIKECSLVSHELRVGNSTRCDEANYLSTPLDSFDIAWNSTSRNTVELQPSFHSWIEMTSDHCRLKPWEMSFDVFPIKNQE